MNLPMSWLNDYMDIDVTPKEYSDRLTMTGSKVEGWENMGESVQNVVAGKVLTCEDHPDSDIFMCVRWTREQARFCRLSAVRRM